MELSLISLSGCEKQDFKCTVMMAVHFTISGSNQSIKKKGSPLIPVTPLKNFVKEWLKNTGSIGKENLQLLI